MLCGLLLIGIAAAAPAVSQPRPFASVSPASADNSNSSRLTIRAVWSSPKAHPGDQRILAIIVRLAPGYHINPNAHQLPSNLNFTPIPTTLTARISARTAVRLGSPQYPQAQQRVVAYANQPLPVFQHRFILYLPVVVRPHARAGIINLMVNLDYQMCSDHTCFAPATASQTVHLQVVPASQTLASIPNPRRTKLFSAFDPTVFAAMAARGQSSVVSGHSSLIHDNFLGWRFSLHSGTPLGLAFTFLTLLVAGVLLNATPCVLPVVPLKIMALHDQAPNAAKRLRLGLIFSAGIIATFIFLGALVAGLITGLHQFQWGQIFAYPAVSIALAAIIFAMALSMLGLYTIRLPRSIYLLNPSHDTALGNFSLGILTAVLSAPCVGPMMGAAVAWAVQQTAVLALASFAVMGLGMALPYLILTANPAWLSRLPRTGPGSVLVKQVMGLLLMAVAVFFLGPVFPNAVRWWAVVALIVVAMLFLIFRTFRITNRLSARITATTLGMILVTVAAVGGWMLTRPGPIRFQPFTAVSFAKARATHHTILVEYTADWCGNCKFLEATTYRDPRLKTLFDRSGYTAFRIDLTRMDNKIGWQRLHAVATAGGIPLAAVYRPGQQKPTILQGLFTPAQLLAALHGTPAG